MSRKRKPRNKCLYCNLEVSRPEKIYCTNACQMKLKTRLVKEDILRSGDSKGHSTATVKKALIELKGHSCELCGLREWKEKLAPLVMDHIDGNHENTSLTNLRLVCANCDTQLPTFKSKNRGKGRHWRRERYKQGKSY